MKIEKKGRAYWLNRYNKFISMGTGVILLGVLSLISKKDIAEFIIPILCGIPMIIYAIFCKKKATKIKK